MSFATETLKYTGKRDTDDAFLAKTMESPVGKPAFILLNVIVNY